MRGVEKLMKMWHELRKHGNFSLLSQGTSHKDREMGGEHVISRNRMCVMQAQRP